jgi:hypothetical protein
VFESEFGDCTIWSSFIESVSKLDKFISLDTDNDISLLIALILEYEKVLIPKHNRNVIKKKFLKIDALSLFMAAKVILIIYIGKENLLNNC